MKNHYFYAAAVLSAALLLSSCQEKQPLVPEFSIDEMATVYAPAEGGTYTAQYTLINEKSDGVITVKVAEDADWVHVSCASGVASIVVDANTDTEARATTLVFSYDYGSESIPGGSIDIEQEAAAPAYDYSYTEGVTVSYPTYYSPDNFMFNLIPATGDDSFYSIDLYVDTEGSNVIPAGTYAITADWPVPNGQLNVTGGITSASLYLDISSGTMTVSYEGSTATVVLEGVNYDGTTHYVVYTGALSF